MLIAIAVVVKICLIQFVEGPELRSKAEKITYKNKVITPARGDICATDGRVLSTSVPYYEIRMDLRADGLSDELFSKNIDSLAWCLSNFFKNKSKYDYRTELIGARNGGHGNRYYRIGNRRVNYHELQQIKRFPLFRLAANQGGFISVQTNMRILTHGYLASRTIGTVRAGGGVSVGIEGAFNRSLKGKEGFQLVQRMPGNVWMPVKSAEEIEPEDGLDVITTIDVDIQDVADAALRRSLSQHGADHGCAILMEVETGDIKAIANLKRDEQGNYSEQFNYAVGEATEPGSTLKVATIMALLEDGYIALGDTVNTGQGRFQIYDRVVTDSKAGGHGRITVQEALEVSSNVAMAKLVTRHYRGKERDFVDRLYAMRLNQPLGLQIAGEATPYIKYPGDKLWSGVSMAMMSMGYEVSMTPLQMLTFYNAIANNGRMMKPRFVKSLERHGQTERTFPPEVIATSICSRATIKKLNQALVGVVERGTAKNLRNVNYQIAGKTGTAQLAQGSTGYRRKGTVSYQASFVGYFPAESPKYSCIVVVNSPTKSVYYGNVVSGPVFKEIADKVYATNPAWFGLIDRRRLAQIPQSKNSRTSDLCQVFGTLNIPCSQRVSEMEWAITQRTSKAVEMRPLRIAHNSVPNVVGMGLKDAIFLLENSGVRVRFRGYGVVRTQSVPAGTSITPGIVVNLEMSSS